MAAHTEGPSAEPSAPGPQAQRTQNLATALRAAAAWAAEQVGGGLCLVFAAAPGDDASDSAARLRAAAGFASAQAARDAAQVLLPQVHQTLGGTATRQIDPPAALAERAKAGLRLFPLVFEDRVHGVLAVGSATPLEPGCGELLATVAAQLAVRLDHARLVEELARHRAAAADPADSGKGEELLKLSEALFAQDIELLRNNEKLGKIEKLKNDFIEKMSRELRTPLNSIIEAIIGVLTGENESLSEPAKASLRQALDDGTAFLRTLQNILDLWRIKQRELPVEIQDMNFPEMIDEAIFSVQDTIGKKQLSVSQRLHQPLPEDPVGPREAGPDRLPAARQRGALHAAGPDRDRGEGRGRAADVQREGHRHRDLPGRPAVHLRRVLSGRRQRFAALAGRRARAHAGARSDHPAGGRGLGLERGRDRNPRQLPDPGAAGRLGGYGAGIARASALRYGAGIAGASASARLWLAARFACGER